MTKVGMGDKLAALPSPVKQKESLLVRRDKHFKGPEVKSLRTKGDEEEDLKESLLIKGPEEKPLRTKVDEEEDRRSPWTLRLKKEEESLTAEEDEKEDLRNGFSSLGWRKMRRDTWRSPCSLRGLGRGRSPL